MKILYGVQGTGNGHITRARHMAESFAAHSDIEVDYLFSGRSANAFFDMQSFANFQSKRGLTFISENGQIKRLKTALKNNLCSFMNDVSSINMHNYDLVINDFEPVSAWAAKKAGVPSLSLSHQAAFLQNVPTQSQSLLDKTITKYFAPTTHTLGTHWYHFGFHIIPPVVALSLVNQAGKCISDPAVNNPILVYLPFDSLHEIRTQLHVLSEYKFVCYHPKIQAIRVDKNIIWQPLSTATFRYDLIKCAGVISNCGFELSTECLGIGKPLLVKPLRKQYEQLSNAYTLQKLGLCSVLNTLNAEDIDDWLQTKQGMKIDFPTNCDSLVNWIKQGDWDSTANICQSLWRQVTFPTQVKAKLESFISVNN
ncbi:MAG: hypothetical protein ACJAVV_000290 [Alphaproteobacteria bacterium]|jgi:uncharacterized protein (TIGR00661 family)